MACLSIIPEKEVTLPIVSQQAVQVCFLHEPKTSRPFTDARTLRAEALRSS